MVKNDAESAAFAVERLLKLLVCSEPANCWKRLCCITARFFSEGSIQEVEAIQDWGASAWLQRCCVSVFRFTDVPCLQKKCLTRCTCTLKYVQGRCLGAGASIKGSPRQRLDEPVSNQHGASEGGHRGFQRRRFTMPLTEPLQRVCSLNNVPFLFWNFKQSFSAWALGSLSLAGQHRICGLKSGTSSRGRRGFASLCWTWCLVQRGASPWKWNLRHCKWFMIQ